MLISSNKIWEIADELDGEPMVDFFTMRSEPIPQPQAGELLTRATLISVDLTSIAGARGHASPQKMGQSLRLPGSAVAEVIESRDLATPPGSLIQTDDFGWQEYAVLEAKSCIRVDQSIAPAEAWLSYLGRPGLIAWLALDEIGQVKPGETVLIDDAADGVGQLAGQLVKAYGGRPVALVSSEEKQQWCDEIGYAASIDTSNTSTLRSTIQQACPNGIDVLFATNGCSIHRVVQPTLNTQARVILGYDQNDQENSEATLTDTVYLHDIQTKRVRVQGFCLADHMHRYAEARNAIAAIASEENFDYLFDVIDGIKSLPDALIRLRNGLTVGKQLVKL